MNNSCKAHGDASNPSAVTCRTSAKAKYTALLEIQKLQKLEKQSLQSENNILRQHVADLARLNQENTILRQLVVELESRLINADRQPRVDAGSATISPVNTASISPVNTAATNNPRPEEGSAAPRTRRSLPAAVRAAVWNTWNGRDAGTGPCQVCGFDISHQDFECGHVVAQSRGGRDTVDNLRPICRTCNRSMGADNLDDFKREYFSQGAASPP
jgi:hypothetical protein